MYTVLYEYENVQNIVYPMYLMYSYKLIIQIVSKYKNVQMLRKQTAQIFCIIII